MAHVRKIKVGNNEYYQLVEKPRGAKGRAEVLLHLGTLPDADSALNLWPQQIEAMRKTGANGRTEKLAGKLDRLRELRAAGVA